jgi:hypothetical protein
VAVVPALRPHDSVDLINQHLLLGCNLLGGASADHQDLFFAQRTVREVLNRSADAPAILSN